MQNNTMGVMKLATFRIGKRTYYVDDRLLELRNVENLEDAIRFDDAFDWHAFLTTLDELRNIVAQQEARRAEIFG